MGISTHGILSSDVALAAIVIFSVALIAWGVPGIILLAWHSSRRSQPLKPPATILDYTYAPALVESEPPISTINLPAIEGNSSPRPWVMGSSESNLLEDEEETREAYLKLRKYYGTADNEEHTKPQDEADSHTVHEQM
jgi:hypothetical protein